MINAPARELALAAWRQQRKRDGTPFELQAVVVPGQLDQVSTQSLLCLLARSKHRAVYMGKVCLDLTMLYMYVCKVCLDLTMLCPVCHLAASIRVIWVCMRSPH